MIYRLVFGIIVGFFICFLWVQVFTENDLGTSITELRELHDFQELKDVPMVFNEEIDDLRSIKQYIYRSFINRLDDRGAKIRADKIRNILNSGSERKDLILQNFEKLLSLGSYESGKLDFFITGVKKCSTTVRARNFFTE